MGGIQKARQDFGCDWDDGELLMQPTGAVYMLHLDTANGRGEIDKWSFVSQELTSRFKGGCYGAVSTWETLKRVCFRPTVDHLKLAGAPMSWWPHARRG